MDWLTCRHSYDYEYTIYYGQFGRKVWFHDSSINIYRQETANICDHLWKTAYVEAQINTNNKAEESISFNALITGSTVRICRCVTVHFSCNFSLICDSYQISRFWGHEYRLAFDSLGNVENLQHKRLYCAWLWSFIFSQLQGTADLSIWYKF